MSRIEANIVIRNRNKPEKIGNILKTILESIFMEMWIFSHWPVAACLCALKEKLEASWLFKLLNCVSWPRGCGLDSGRRTKTRVYWWWPAVEWAVITRVVSSPTPAGGSLSLLLWQTRERERDKKQEERQCHAFFHLATSPCSWFCGSVTINRVVSFTSHFLNIRLQTSKCEWFCQVGK